MPALAGGSLPVLGSGKIEQLKLKISNVKTVQPSFYPVQSRIEYNYSIVFILVVVEDAVPLVYAKVYLHCSRILYINTSSPLSSYQVRQIVSIVVVIR